MRFIVERTVLFGDCDPAGAIYTPRVSYYVVEAVNDFLSRQLGSPAIRSILDMGILPPARQLSIDFTSPLRWDDRVCIEVAVAHVGNRSFTFHVAGDVDGRAAFHARLTQVCISPQTLEPVNIPQALRAVLEAAWQEG